MHTLSFLAARAVCLNSIDQCADIVRNGPLPHPDVLDSILMFEEDMVLTEQARAKISEAEYTFRVSKTVRYFASLLDKCEH